MEAERELCKKMITKFIDKKFADPIDKCLYDIFFLLF